LNGDQAIAKILKAEGVEWIACFPAQGLIDACTQAGIRPVLVRQERAGVNMADAFSRINNGNKIGVFTMQTGPGAENAFGGVAQAYADSVPILLLPGGQPGGRQDVHPNFESTKNYGGITKFMATINLPGRISELMGMAFSQLKHGRPGPVLLELPRDVTGAEIDEASLNYTPVKPFKSGANPDDVRDLVKAVLAADYPIINAGQGVLYAEATDELVEFAELTNIPVFTTLAGKSGFPEDHALALGTGAGSGPLMVHRAFQKTDFILGIGTSLTISGFNAPLPTGKIMAQVTNCAEDLNKDYRIANGAVGDAKLVLRQMIEEVKSQIGEHGRGDVHGVAAEVAKDRAEWMAEWSPRLNSDEVPISPYRVLTELTKAINPRDAIVTHDSGYPREQFVPFWPALNPRSYIGWGKSTQLGYGLGLALGAKLAAPDKTVVNVMGDAAFGMSGLDIETAARSEIPILTVVLNNGVMTHYGASMPAATERWGSNRLGGEYAKVAEALGAYGERVESPDQVGPAIQRALEAHKSGQPALLEMMTKEEETISRYWER
jgi:acetolactate synthase-1/2/3 large subunit|tara:strand:+ start:1318 stop:2964 length:1647 start_codon:yes stop_codon:yes gene_type:complete